MAGRQWPQIENKATVFATVAEKLFKFDLLTWLLDWRRRREFPCPVHFDLPMYRSGVWPPRPLFAQLSSGV